MDPQAYVALGEAVGKTMRLEGELKVGGGLWVVVRATHCAALPTPPPTPHSYHLLHFTNVGLDLNGRLAPGGGGSDRW